MTTATSASDRYGAAREALEYAENIHVSYPAAHKRLTAALRALIEPPAVEGSIEDIAQRIAKPFEDATDPRGSDLHPPILEAVTHAIHAGITEAWCSWEPENAPGVYMATRAQIKAVRELVEKIMFDAGSGSPDTVGTYSARIFDALGVRL